MKVSDNLIHEQPCSPGEMNNMQIHHSSCPPFLYDDISKSIQYQNSDLNHVVAVPLHSSITYSDGIALFVFGIRTPLHSLQIIPLCSTFVVFACLFVGILLKSICNKSALMCEKQNEQYRIRMLSLRHLSQSALPVSPLQSSPLQHHSTEHFHLKHQNKMKLYLHLDEHGVFAGTCTL